MSENKHALTFAAFISLRVIYQPGKLSKIAVCQLSSKFRIIVLTSSVLISIFMFQSNFAKNLQKNGPFPVPPLIFFSKIQYMEIRLFSFSPHLQIFTCKFVDYIVRLL